MPGLPESPSRPVHLQRGLCTPFLCLAALAAAAGAADAAPPVAPHAAGSLEASQAFVGDPLLGMGPGEPGSLYGLSEDLSVHMASTTKSFTLLLAVEAVEAGYVNLNDLVTISPKAAGINDNHAGSGQNTHTNQGFTAGQLIAFEDLLYSMMHTSAGDASIAIAQHVAVALDPTLEEASAAEQEDAFTDLMNARAAELGLEDSVFHNAYGGDHVHESDNTAGPDTDHGASTRDMATWFAAGLELPLFREIAGFDGTWSFGTAYTVGTFSTTGGGSYPGRTGGKAGSGGGCGRCGVASARRAGRELVEAFTQGTSGDGAALLDYGFAALFHPVQQAQSAPWTGGWLSEDLACVSPHRAASAVVDGSGQTQVLVWEVDVAGGSVVHGNSADPGFEPVGGISGGSGQEGGDEPLVFVGSDTYTTAASSPETDTFAAPEKPEEPARRMLTARDGGGRGDSSHTDEKAAPTIPAVASQARIASVGLGRLAVVEESSQGVRIFLYGIDDDTPFLMDQDFVGEGSEPRVAHVELPSGAFAVVVHRRPGGASQVTAYRVEWPAPGSGLHTLSNPTDVGTFPEVASHEIAALGGPSGRFVVASETLSGGRAVRSFKLDNITGILAAEDTWSFGSTSTRVVVTRVPGFDTSQVFALGFVNFDGAPSLEVLRADASGTIASLGKAASDETIAAGEALRIAPYREEGVLLAYEDAGSRRLEVWALDASSPAVAITPAMLTREDAGAAGLSGLCRLPASAAEGDFLLSQGVPAATALRIEAWRSAPRP